MEAHLTTKQPRSASADNNSSNILEVLRAANRAAAKGNDMLAEQFDRFAVFLIEDRQRRRTEDGDEPGWLARGLAEARQ
jgi:hypothetical protein